MSYCIIDRHAVFFNEQRYKELSEKMVHQKGKDASWAVESRIQGTRASGEKDKWMYEVLRLEYEKDPENFHKRWVSFDLWGFMAQENVWDLLYDYCHLHGNGWLSDIRDPVERMTFDFEGDSYSYPMGKTFALNHLATNRSNWLWRVVHKARNRSITITIDVERVLRLVGDLRCFNLYTKEFAIECGVNLRVSPLCVTA